MNTEVLRLYIRKFWWVAVILLGIVLAIGFVIWQTLRDNGATLDAYVVPDDATVIVDGNSYSAGKIKLQPGVYEVTAEREGFESLTQKVTVSDELQQVQFALTPVSDEAKEWAQKNQQKYLDIESAGGQQAQAESAEIVQRYPLLSKLPFDGSFYKINYAVEDRDKEIYYIRIDATSPMGRDVALRQIKDWGYEPTDYRIVFPGMLNPLNPSDEEFSHEH